MDADLKSCMDSMYEGVHDGDNEPDATTAAASIKAVVFEYIKNSESLPGLLEARDAGGVASDIISACHKTAIRSGLPYCASVGILATSVMHYVLTASMIKSQRKITYKGTEIDVVIPDAHTIESDPARALIVYVAMTDDISKIRGDLEAILAVHPVSENVWAVMDEHVAAEYERDRHGNDGARKRGRGTRGIAADKTGRVRRFAVSEDGGSFAAMMFAAMERFKGRDAGAGRLRIVGGI